MRGRSRCPAFYTPNLPPPPQTSPHLQGAVALKEKLSSSWSLSPGMASSLRVFFLQPQQQQLWWHQQHQHMCRCCGSTNNRRTCMHTHDAPLLFNQVQHNQPVQPSQPASQPASRTYMRLTWFLIVCVCRTACVGTGGRGVCCMKGP